MRALWSFATRLTKLGLMFFWPVPVWAFFVIPWFSRPDGSALSLWNMLFGNALGDTIMTWPLLFMSWYLAWTSRIHLVASFIISGGVMLYAWPQASQIVTYFSQMFSVYGLSLGLREIHSYTYFLGFLTCLTFVMAIGAFILAIPGATEGAIKISNRGFKKFKISESGLHGNSRLATVKELRNVTKVAETKKAQLLIGSIKGTKGERVYWPLEAHPMVFAPTRSGKGVGFIMNNIFGYGGPIIINDPKAESLMVTGRYRSQKRQIVAFDPYKICEKKGSDYIPAYASWNPLDYIGEDVEDDIEAIMEALIVPPDGAKGADFWENSSVLYIAGLIQYCHYIRKAFPDRGNLPYVLDLLNTTDPDDLRALWEAMVKIGGRAKAAGALLMNTAEQTGAGIITTARVHMGWLTSKPLANAVRTSTFSMEDIAEDKIDIYICIPLHNLKLAKVFMRIMTIMPMKTILRGKVPKSRVLMIIDEAPLMGRLDALPDAFRLMSGARLSVMPIAQTMAGMEKVYGKHDFEDMRGNAELVIAFGLKANNQDGSEWVSKASGSYGAIQETKNSSSGNSAKDIDVFSNKSKNEGVNYQEVKREVLSIDDIANLPSDDIIVIPRAKDHILRRTALLQNVKYYEQPDFKSVMDRNPLHIDD
ncbi:type IV secretory system conjugative DNA transfer family protein [Brucella thiophenivorans]|uniref:TraM recognition site of TraD and TraG family protein n=1 Tax=Brucella thiophenivorans TaxID=571255 RepID=A0A256FTV9_9HYPH|nr:type IV secretory system conjugative DNA transfer family protein [Brucella thiophenivorans]OYR18254.1 traM recognition site of TraD and TraG family protein [Brucella thiophenivorans]